MTEQLAKTKYCPFLQNQDGLPTLCQGSKCMAWENSPYPITNTETQETLFTGFCKRLGGNRD